MKPRILDLFSGAGGAARGLQEAGFYVVGVDIKPQPHYCGDEFHCADALTYPLEGFDAFWASPPCQSYSVSRHMFGVKGAPTVIGTLRESLNGTGKPYIIENVPGAPLVNPIELSGMSFGLKIIRRRLFELHGFDIVLIPSPRQVKNYRREGYLPYHHDANRKDGHLPNIWTKGRLQEAMGIDWMDINEMTQAIPPAYSRFIGEQLIKSLKGGS